MLNEAPPADHLLRRVLARAFDDGQGGVRNARMTLIPSPGGSKGSAGFLGVRRLTSRMHLLEAVAGDIADGQRERGKHV
jgi:hypothetical protein